MKIVFLLFALTVFAAPKVSKEKIYLALPKNRVEETRAPFIPYRVYWIYEKKYKQWIRVLSDEKGAIVEPHEALITGAVLPGPALGYKPGSKNQRYEKDGSWKETKNKVGYSTVTMTEPARRNDYTFLPYNEGGTPAVKGNKK